jgi:hypothetical protein
MVRPSVNFKGWPFLVIDRNRSDWTYAIHDGLETFIQTTDFGGDDLMDFWRLLQSGFFYHRTTMRPSAQGGGTGLRYIVGFDQTAIFVAEAIHCLTRLYEGLLDDDDDGVVFVASLVNTKDRLLHFPNSRYPVENTSRIPEIVVERRRALADWRAAAVDYALDVLSEIYQRFNWVSPEVRAIHEHE